MERTSGSGPVVVPKQVSQMWPAQKSGGSSARQGSFAFFIPAVVESNPHYDEDKKARAKHCVDVGVRAGLQKALIACGLTAVPTILGARTIPWARHNLNYTAQALIISAATIATYFIVTEQTIMECTKATSWADVRAARAAAAEADR